MLSGITKLTQKIEYLAAEKSIIFHIASHYYKGVIKNEIDLAGITEDDRILCIGGGFCPFSAILLHQKTGASVTVIDNDSTCIPKAKKIVEKLNLQKFIHIECKEGCCRDLCVANFTVVHFALQITPIEHVFTEVEKKVRPGTKLLVRRPQGYLNSMYCKLSEKLLSYGQHIKHSRLRNIGSTFLYIKGSVPI